MQTNTHNGKIFLTHKTYPKGIRKRPHIQVPGSIRKITGQKGQFLHALKEERGDKDHEEWVSCVPWGAVRQLSWGKCWEEWPHPHRSTVPPSLSMGVRALGLSRSGSPSIDNTTNTLGGQQLCNCSGRCLVAIPGHLCRFLFFLEAILFQWHQSWASLADSTSHTEKSSGGVGCAFSVKNPGPLSHTFSHGEHLLRCSHVPSLWTSY